MLTVEGSRDNFQSVTAQLHKCHTCTHRQWPARVQLYCMAQCACTLTTSEGSTTVAQVASQVRGCMTKLSALRQIDCLAQRVVTGYQSVRLQASNLNTAWYISAMYVMQYWRSKLMCNVIFSNHLLHLCYWAVCVWFWLVNVRQKSLPGWAMLHGNGRYMMPFIVGTAGGCY